MHKINGDAERTSHMNTISPSKTAVKAWIFNEQTAGVLRQTVRDTIRCTATANIESCVKLTDFSQRFAVLLAQRLQMRSALRFLCSRILETKLRHGSDTKRQQFGQPNSTTNRAQKVYSINVCSTTASHNFRTNRQPTQLSPAIDATSPYNNALHCLEAPVQARPTIRKPLGFYPKQW